jgi:flavin-dependent thymidylate synthase
MSEQKKEAWEGVHRAIEDLRSLDMGSGIDGQLEDLEALVDKVNKSGPGENTRLQKWVDPAMYAAAPVPEGGPRVYLLTATPDPLGSVAAAALMYQGQVIRDKSEVTHQQRQDILGEMLKTKIKAPLEFVQFHFLIEGVTRGFTHQMVRQRTATYVQESTRFAVKEDVPVGRPPSLVGMNEKEQGRTYPDNQKGRLAGAWDSAIQSIQEAYEYCVNNGMPAEDARGLLPTNLLTRLHYRTDLRALLDHAGNRLCTQAQFEWRLVFAKIAEAIRSYNYLAPLAPADLNEQITFDYYAEVDRWQWEAIAGLLKPICYATGKCEFMASFDRACSIRDRVQANNEIGRLPAEWGEELDNVEGNPIVSGVGPQSVVRDESQRPVFIGAISPAEWLADPGAAR